MKNAPTRIADRSALDTRNHNLFPDLEPPVLSATWPKRGTRADEALQMLLKGPINQRDYCAGWRLAAYIKQLQYDGWHVIKRDIFKPDCRGLIVEYSLDRQHPAVWSALTSREVGSC